MLKFNFILDRVFTMKGLPAPIKQKASEGGRVMRQTRQKESVKSEASAKSASTKGAQKSGMKY